MDLILRTQIIHAYDASEKRPSSKLLMPDTPRHSLRHWQQGPTQSFLKTLEESLPRSPIHLTFPVLRSLLNHTFFSASLSRQITQSL
jgi:hypothetical protein